jgi:hypothetical protein
MMNPSTTLEMVKKARPEPALWSAILDHLGQNADGYDPNARLGLGDFAIADGTASAFWSVRALAWRSPETRRAVVSKVLLPAAKQAASRHQDQRVSICINVVDAWVRGKDDACMELVASSAWSAGCEPAAAVAWASLPDYPGWACRIVAGQKNLRRIHTTLLAAFPPLAKGVAR